MKYKLTFAFVASLTSTAFAEFKAPLPEFKSEKQLAEWRADQTTNSTSQGYVAEETAFYTGKPYLAFSGSYAFRYRSYSPKMARWTSEDPSGFPDGVNNHLYVNNVCMRAMDPDGLEFLIFTGTRLQLWSGTGWVSATRIDRGEMQSDWAATSGPHGNGELPRGWYSVGAQSQTLGSITNNPPSRESDYKVDGVWQQGTMSAWNGTRANGATQYKFALNPIHNTNVGGRSGFKIHPDGGVPGTEGCVGITNYNDSVAVFNHLSGAGGTTLYFE